jgi:Ca2+-transporting ATPase
MGSRGTDVAREASALVLLDDDFASIVHAIRLGRRIFENLRKAMGYIVAIHVPIAATALAPVLLQWPLVLMPVHIVFLELIIDPASSVVFETEPDERDVMRRQPRDPRAPLFDRRMIGLSLLQGTSVAVIVLGVFALALATGRGESEARALTFTTLVIGNLSLILANRSRSGGITGALGRPTPALGIVVIGALMLLALVLYVPALADLFLFAPLDAGDLSMAVAAGLASVLWLQVLETLRQHISRALTH